MEWFVEVLVHEYQIMVDQVKGWFWVQLLSSIALISLGCVLFWNHFEKISRFFKDRHVSFLITNVCYLVAVLCGVHSAGIMFWVGGMSTELVDKIVAKKYKELWFVGSATFMYVFCICCLASIHLVLGLVLGVIASLVLGKLFIRHQKFTMHLVEVLAASVLLSIGSTGLWELWTLSLDKGLYYIQRTSCGLIRVIFGLLAMSYITNFMKYLIRVNVEFDSSQREVLD
ncbi:hypothetical protein NEHOM01_2009 [Nematocida homosporus]|uniref:uncharacterized protein n=1 Tax=Nematocida homosporus TaxID=1912981 RepID=UPI00221F35A5|nr:uncharacterized protein NEHOM01_2009 [Nematocida homosporus]KAI5187211.1 hypothetical protein NEHOM01_2009 [Nematocida homosporus]